MSKEADAKRYLEAKTRALSRATTQTELCDESQSGFRMGLGVAHAQVPGMTKSLTRNLHSETNYTFGVICGLLAKLEAVKGKHYGASFMRRGELAGVKANVDRKFDRLEVLLDRSEGEEAEKGENVTQNLGDLAVYVMKWLALRAEVAPEEFADWMEEIRKL